MVQEQAVEERQISYLKCEETSPVGEQLLAGFGHCLLKSL